MANVVSVRMRIASLRCWVNMGVINLNPFPGGVITCPRTIRGCFPASSFTSALEELPGWSKADDTGTLSATSDKDSDNGK